MPDGQQPQGGDKNNPMNAGIGSFMKEVGGGLGRYAMDVLTRGGYGAELNENQRNAQTQMLEQYHKRIAQGEQLTGQDYTDFIGAGGDPGVLHSLDAEAGRMGKLRADNLKLLDSIEQHQEMLEHSGQPREYSADEMRLWRMAASSNDNGMQQLIGSFINGHLKMKTEQFKSQAEIQKAQLGVQKEQADVERAKIGERTAAVHEAGATERLGQQVELGHTRQATTEANLHTAQTRAHEEDVKAGAAGQPGAMTPQQRNKAIMGAFNKFPMTDPEDETKTKNTSLLRVADTLGLKGQQRTIWQAATADMLDAIRSGDQERAYADKQALFSVLPKGQESMKDQINTWLLGLGMEIGEGNDPNEGATEGGGAPAASPTPAPTPDANRNRVQLGDPYGKPYQPPKPASPAADGAGPTMFPPGYGASPAEVQDAIRRKKAGEPFP